MPLLNRAYLEDADAVAEHDRSVRLPAAEVLAAVAGGWFVKICVRFPQTREGRDGERFWVRVIDRRGNMLHGEVSNDLVAAAEHGLTDTDHLSFPTSKVIAVQDSSTPAWPFADPPDTRAFTTRAVLEDGLPVLLVTHDDDGDWQFLCGTTNEPDQARLIHLRHVLEIDQGLVALADLPSGWIARRAAVSTTWMREARPADWD